MLSDNFKGITLSIMSGATFGLIPLFVIPLAADGIGYSSSIFYRFLIGSFGILTVLLYRQNSLRISRSDFWRIFVLALLYIISSVALLNSYDFISSGVSTSLIYTNPIWCALIGTLFLHERMTWELVLAIVLSVIGVAMLSGAFNEGGVRSLWGIVLGLISGMCYGLYLIALPRLKISKMPSLKLNFYIFLQASAIIALYSFFFDGGLDAIRTTDSLTGVILLGLIPTAFSNICVTMALRLINTTIVSILGAFEPFTAMVIGIAVFNEPCDACTVAGCLLVLIAVTMIVIKKR